MGGAKKKSMAQMEKQQVTKEEKPEKKDTKKSKSAAERKAGSIIMPDLSSKEFLSEISKMRAVTPYVLASKYGVKFGVAKDALEELEKRGILELVVGSSRLKIYKATATHD